LDERDKPDVKRTEMKHRDKALKSIVNVEWDLLSR
jgi:hypothetical protein